jgi:membrane protein
MHWNASFLEETLGGTRCRRVLYAEDLNIGQNTVYSAMIVVEAAMPQSAQVISEAGSPAAERTIIIEPGFWAKNRWLLRCAFLAAYEDNCFGIAKGAAYSFLLSLFPILTTMAALLFEVNAESVVHVIARFAREVLPPGTEDLVVSRLHEHGGGVSLPVFSVLLSLWAGSGAMASLLEGFQAAYRIPSGRPMLKQRAMAIFLVLIAAVPSVGASCLILFGNRIEEALIHNIADISAPVHFAWRMARYIVAFATVTFVTAMLYYFGPNHRPELRHTNKIGSRFARVWPGALLATSLWLLATAGFAWYVHHLANYNIFYGSMGTVVILLIWLYLLACITLLGCEFNAERERMDSLSILS